MSKQIRWMALFVALVVALGAVSASAGGGAGPNDALAITNTVLKLAPFARVWHWFDYAGDRSLIDLTVDAGGATDARVSLYTPENIAAWGAGDALHAIGIGAHDAARPEHDLVWQGRFVTAGRYFVVVENNSGAEIAYRLDVTGDGVKTVAATPTPTLVPAFTTPTPLGKPLSGRLVFQVASGNDIYTVNGDGTKLTRVTYGLDPAWSHDGKRIAFARWNQPAGLYVANADGSNERLVYRADKIKSPTWSADDTHLAFSMQKGGKAGSKFCFGLICFSAPDDEFWKLGIVNVDDGTLSEPKCPSHCFAPSFSNDDNTIVFNDGAIGLLQTYADGSDAWTIVNNMLTRAPVVSPDGTKIVYQFSQHDHWEIARANIDGSGITRLTFEDFLAFRKANNVAPTWSPDGKQILFLSDRNRRWEFFVMNADGSNPHQVLKNVTDALTIRYDYASERVAAWTK
jgi:dipeptidyl aminopeptidase/acylaminoacyl peptidase